MGQGSINRGGGGQREHSFEEGEAGARTKSASRNEGSVWGWAEGEEASLQGLRGVGHDTGTETCSMFVCRQEMGLAGSRRKRCPISQDGWSAAAPGTACPSALWVSALTT